MNTNKQSKAKLTVINGNRIIMISNPSYISSTIGFMIKAGSSNDFKGKNGIANMVCEILYRNYHNCYVKNSSTIEYKINKIVEREYSYYYIKTQKDDIIYAIEQLKLLLISAKFDEDSLQIIKNYSITEIETHSDNIDHKLSYMVHENVFSRQVIGKSIFGKHKTMKNITTEDLYDFYNKHYNNKNLTVVIATRHDIKYMNDLLEKHIEDKILGSNGIFTSFKKYTFHKKNKYLYKNIRSTSVNIIFPTKGFKDYHNKMQAEIACHIINNRYSLNNCYIIRASLIPYNSIILINIHVSLSLLRLSDFLENFQNEIRDYQLDHNEFNLAAQQVSAAKQEVQYDSVACAFEHVFHFLHLRKIKKNSFDREIIGTINKQTIENFMRNYIQPSNMSIFCIGPKHQKVYAYAA